MHIGQAVVPTTPAVGQPLVIDPHQAQDRRLQIVNRYDVLYGAVSEFVGSSMPVTSTDASTCHPYAKTLWIVVSTVATLSKGSTSEFAGANH